MELENNSLNNLKTFEKFIIKESTNLDSIILGKTFREVYALTKEKNTIYGIGDKIVVAADSFEREIEAEQYLNDMGYSIGRMQGPSPRGIKLGTWDIQKWRNLGPDHRETFDGVLLAIENKYYVIYFNFPE